MRNSKAQLILALLVVVILGFVVSNSKTKSLVIAKLVQYDDSMIAFAHSPDATVYYFGIDARDNNWRVYNQTYEELISIHQGSDGLIDDSKLPAGMTSLGKQQFGQSTFSVFRDVPSKDTFYQEYTGGYGVIVTVPKPESMNAVSLIDISSIVIKPGSSNDVGMEKYTDRDTGLSFEYPKDLRLKEKDFFHDSNPTFPSCAYVKDIELSSRMGFPGQLEGGEPQSYPAFYVTLRKADCGNEKTLPGNEKKVMDTLTGWGLSRSDVLVMASLVPSVGEFSGTLPNGALDQNSPTIWKTDCATVTPRFFSEQIIIETDKCREGPPTEMFHKILSPVHGMIVDVHGHSGYFDEKMLQGIVLSITY